MTNYINNKDLQTWVLKRNGELIVFYEKEFHPKENEVELINMGILKEFQAYKNFGTCKATWARPIFTVFKPCKATWA